MQAHSFGNWLKTRRKARDLTQSELAEQVGCSAAAIRKLEAEERRPSAQIVQRLAEIFEIPQNEQANFLRFARGEMRSAPAEAKEDFPWQLPNSLIRSNLPATVTSLIGREQEIADVREYLSKAHIRLVTLIGPPGIGKTRLSIEAARAALTDFLDGVFFVPLAPLSDPGLIAQTIAQSLGYVQTSNLPVEEQLKEGIGDKRMLVLLDNCEHLIEAVAALVSRLLSACPQLKILATSRESFRIEGEWLYPVQALGVPALDVPAFDLPLEPSSLTLERASSFPALTLFAERAHAVRPDFVLNIEILKTVSAICARLDGLPLAIELIAARMRLMSPEALLTRLNDQFILSADGMRAPTGRQKTLNNSIAWSYDLLSEDEQKLFVYLSVFSGGFTLEAAEAMFSQSFRDPPVSNLIASMLDKSLLKVAPHFEKSSEARYTMLVTIREYARERLQEIGEDTEIRGGHLAYFLDLAEKADLEIHGPAQVEWIDRLEVEHDNFRAALDWSLSNGQTNVALRLLNALCWPWLMRTHYSEIRGWFEKVSILHEIAAYPALYARLLNFMGHMNWLLGNYREAQSFLNESQAIWLKLGPRGEQGLAEALSILGMVASSGKTGLQAAQSFLEQGFELYERHEARWGMAFDLIFLGWLAILQNNDTSAFALLEKSMNLFEHLGDIWGKSRVSDLLGGLFLRQGNYEKARFYFEQNLEFDEEIKLKPGIVNALGSLGDLHRHQHNYIQAKQYYEKSLEISRTYGMKEDWGLGLYFLGLLALHQNSYSAARGYFVDYIKAERESLNKVNAYIFVLSQAAVSAGSNQLERAARLSGAAQGISETLEYKISRFNQAEFDRHIQIAREQLEETRFQELQAAGRAMTMEHAIAYALEDDSS